MRTSGHPRAHTSRRKNDKYSHNQRSIQDYSAPSSPCSIGMECSPSLR
jgi:hypothetical protein